MSVTARQFLLGSEVLWTCTRHALSGVARVGLLLFFAFVLAFGSSLPSLAQQIGGGDDASPNGELEIITTQEEGFGRIILNFKGRNLLPGYSIKQENSIFVARFDEPVNATPVTTLPSILPDYITVARLDPDGLGLRIALKPNMRINTMEAGERLYVDLLPSSWSGLPPPLPAEVVQELAKRAEEALRLARSLEQARQGTQVRPKLDLRVGDHPTFTRIAFIWNIPFDSTFERQGPEVRVNFNHKADVDLSRLRAELPPLMSDIQVGYDDVGTQFKIFVAPTSDVRAFREDDAYIVDITGDKVLFQAQGAQDSITRAVSNPGDTGVLVANGIGGDNPAGGALLAGNNRVGNASNWNSDQAKDAANDIILGPGPNGESQDNALFANSQVTDPIDPNTNSTESSDANLQSSALSAPLDNRYLAVPPADPMPQRPPAANSEASSQQMLVEDTVPNSRAAIEAQPNMLNGALTQQQEAIPAQPDVVQGNPAQDQTLPGEENHIRRSQCGTYDRCHARFDCSNAAC